MRTQKIERDTTPEASDPVSKPASSAWLFVAEFDQLILPPLEVPPQPLLNPVEPFLEVLLRLGGVTGPKIGRVEGQSKRPEVLRQHLVPLAHQDLHLPDAGGFRGCGSRPASSERAMLLAQEVLKSSRANSSFRLSLFHRLSRALALSLRSSIRARTRVARTRFHEAQARMMVASAKTAVATSWTDTMAGDARREPSTLALRYGRGNRRPAPRGRETTGLLAALVAFSARSWTSTNPTPDFGSFSRRPSAGEVRTRRAGKYLSVP